VINRPSGERICRVRIDEKLQCRCCAQELCELWSGGPYCSPLYGGPGASDVWRRDYSCKVVHDSSVEKTVEVGPKAEPCRRILHAEKCVCRPLSETTTLQFSFHPLNEDSCPRFLRATVTRALRNGHLAPESTSPLSVDERNEIALLARVMEDQVPMPRLDYCLLDKLSR